MAESSVNTTTRPTVWLITGCSSGFGKLFAHEALNRGDKVIATARKLGSLDDLKAAGAAVLELDVGDTVDAIKAKAKEAEEIYGGVDVVVNNAGFGALGFLEELGVEGMKIQFDTNFFGVINVTTAFLSYMRPRRSGTIVIIGSRSGWRTLPISGAYAASKAAIHAYGDALALEVAPFNLRVLTLIPGGFYTQGGSTGAPTLSGPATSYPGFTTFPDYEPLRARADALVKSLPGTQPGDPAKFAQVLVDVVKGQGVWEGKSWPEGSRLVVGSDSEKDIRIKIESVEKGMREYKDVVEYTDRAKNL